MNALQNHVLTVTERGPQLLTTMGLKKKHTPTYDYDILMISVLPGSFFAKDERETSAIGAS